MASPVMVTVSELADQMGKDKSTLYAWAKRADDPLPLRYVKGEIKNGAILVSELEEWFMRNTVYMNERR